MAAAYSTTLANALLNAVLRNTTFTSPATVWVALYTTALGPGDTATEVTGGSYVRVQVTFVAPVNGATTNTAALSILGMPAVTVNSIGIRSASTAGSLYFYGVLAQPKTTNAGDTFNIPAGDLDIALT